MILLRLGVAGEDEHAPIRGGEVNVQHLDGGELLKHGAGVSPGASARRRCFSVTWRQ